jgi:hypothetical protein
VLVEGLETGAAGADESGPPGFHGARWSDNFMSKTTRQYKDSRSAPPPTAEAGPAGNLSKINEELQDVTRIMTKNMEDLLWRGDSLDRASSEISLPSPAR